MRYCVFCLILPFHAAFGNSPDPVYFLDCVEAQAYVEIQELFANMTNSVAKHCDFFYELREAIEERYDVAISDEYMTHFISTYVRSAEYNNRKHSSSKVSRPAQWDTHRSSNSINRTLGFHENFCLQVARNTPQHPNQDNENGEEVVVPAGVIIGGIEVFSGALLFIVPGMQPVGMFLMGDGARRVFDTLQSYEDEKDVERRRQHPA